MQVDLNQSNGKKNCNVEELSTTYISGSVLHLTWIYFRGDGPKKNGEDFSKMALMGGWKIFTRNGGKPEKRGWFFNGGDWKFLVSLHRWQTGSTPLFYEDPPILLTPSFFKFCPTPVPHHFLVTSNLHSKCSFCYPVSLAEWVIMPYLMCYFTWW